jgi:hypothetical protein
MTFRSSLSKALAAVVALVPAFALLGDASSPLRPAPPPRSGGGERRCRPVGGTLMTNLGAIDQNTTLGTATGDLRGAVAAGILSVVPGANGVLTFQIQHHWVTEAGDTIFFNPVTEVAAPLNQQVFGITLPQPLRVTGGTGRFDGATGSIAAFGSVDLAHGQTVFRYSGQVCVWEGPMLSGEEP